MFDNSFSTSVAQIWSQYVYPQMYGNLTMAESARLQEMFNRDLPNLSSQLMQVSQQRGGQLSQQDVANVLMNYANQRAREMKQYNPYGAFNMNMFNNNMPSPSPFMQQPMMPQPMMNRPMQPLQGAMPDPVKTQMANIYDQPAPAKPIQPAMPSANTGFVNTEYVPTMKVAASFKEYQAPTRADSNNLDPKKYGIESGSVSVYTNIDGQRITSAYVMLNKWVTRVHTALAEIVDKLQPDFIVVGYKNYSIVDIAYSTLSKAFADIKASIQQSKTENADYFTTLANALKTLDNKSRGTSKLVEQLVIKAFNKVMCTKQLDNDSYLVDSCDKIISYAFEKNIEYRNSINNVVAYVVDTVLMTTCIYDADSEECEPYLRDMVIKNNKTCEALKAENEEAYTKWVKSISVIVSEVKYTVYSNMVFDNMIQQQDEVTWINGENKTLDTTPVDCDAEFFIKKIKDFNDRICVCSMVMAHQNFTINYLVSLTDDEIYLRPSKMF